MEIIYKTVELEEKSIVLENAVDVKINGIKITECPEGIRVSVEHTMLIKGQSGNAVVILKE